MQSVTLTYKIGATTYSKAFDVYSVNPYNVELFRRLHIGIAGQASEKNTGYRSVIDVLFAPLNYDKSLSFWLIGFFALGNTRTITFEAVTYNVTIKDKNISFDFDSTTFFGNSWTVRFYEMATKYITDTGSTRILKPLYVPGGQGISSETLSIYVNLADDLSSEAVKTNLNFVNDDDEDLSYAYAHLIQIDFGPIQVAAYRTWINEFVQWNHKQIDTTAVDPVNGKVYDVVFMDNKVEYQFEAGVKDAMSVTLLFREKTPRTALEAVAGPAARWDEVVSDEFVSQ